VNATSLVAVVARGCDKSATFVTMAVLTGKCPLRWRF